MPSSYAQLLAAARDRIDRLDARLLLQHVCHCAHRDLIARPETLVSPDEAAAFLALLARRTAGEPLAYLTGRGHFYGLELAVSPAVLIPRPETELLVDLALARLQPLAAPRVLDLGTGSGCIPLALARHCPAARLTAVDVSPVALAVARQNGEQLGLAVDWRLGDWLQPVAGESFELIVSNPPYVAAGDPHLQQNGLPHEPQGALSDGGDGLSCLRRIIADAPAHLAPGGWLLLEHGYDQGENCRNLLAAAGLEAVATWRDLAGIERVSGARSPATRPTPNRETEKVVP